jgi:hypothetical protein
MPVLTKLRRVFKFFDLEPQPGDSPLNAFPCDGEQRRVGKLALGFREGLAQRGYQLKPVGPVGLAAIHWPLPPRAWVVVFSNEVRTAAGMKKRRCPIFVLGMDLRLT